MSEVNTVNARLHDLVRDGNVDEWIIDEANQVLESSTQEGALIICES